MAYVDITYCTTLQTKHILEEQSVFNIIYLLVHFESVFYCSKSQSIITHGREGEFYTTSKQLGCNLYFG